MPALAPHVGPRDKVVLFDGVCNLCAAWTRFLVRFDTRAHFKLASVQSDAGRAILTHFRLPVDDVKTMAVVEGPLLSTKSTAFLRVMRSLPFPFPLVSLFVALPAPLRDWAYDRVALNRYRLFGKSDVCMMPSPAHARRFL